MRARGVLWTACTLGAGSVVACSAGYGGPGREGNLGHGMFEYQCLTDQDPACPDGSQTMAGCSGFAASTPASLQCFPSLVAVGGRFRINYTPNASTVKVGNPALRGVATEFLSTLGDGQFKALKPGYVGVYSQSTVDSALVDYTLIRIGAIARIQVVDVGTKKGAPPSGVTVSTGTIAAYKINALDTNGSTLAGAVEGFLWETSDDKILALGDDPHTATMHVHAVAPGTATLTAYADDTKTVKTTLTVLVQ